MYFVVEKLLIILNLQIIKTQMKTINCLCVYRIIHVTDVHYTNLIRIYIFISFIIYYILYLQNPQAEQR